MSRNTGAYDLAIGELRQEGGVATLCDAVAKADDFGFLRESGASEDGGEEERFQKDGLGGAVMLFRIPKEQNVNWGVF